MTSQDRSPEIRSMRLDDIDGVIKVQAECYTSVAPESVDSLASKLKLAPQYSLVAIRSEQVVAYLLAHPWIQGSVPKLDTVLTSLPECQNLFYLHDLAVGLRARGERLGERLVTEVLGRARTRGFALSGLIAVQASQPFWERFGFRSPDHLAEEIATTIAGYEESAVYLECPLLS